jgi:hypothetical protein
MQQENNCQQINSEAIPNTIPNRTLTDDDRTMIMYHINDINRNSECYDDCEKEHELTKILCKKCKYVSDLPDFFRHVANLDYVDPHSNEWKILEVIFGPLIYRDDVRFK